MAEGVSLRAATREDLALLTRWSRAFEAEDAEPGSAPKEPFIAETFTAFESGRGRGEVLVIERDGAAAGYVILVAFWSNEFRGEAALLDELYVAPPFRGGTGALALAAVEARARARGARVLSLEVLPSNHRVHGLYRRAGFVANRTLYQKKLAG